MAVNVQSLKVQFSLQGIKPIVQRLDSFAKKLRRKTLTKCGNEASKRVLKIMKSKAPSTPKGFKKSLGRKVKVYQSSRLFWVVGARTNYWLTINAVAKWFTDHLKRRRRIPVTENTPEKYATKKRLASRYVRKAEKLSGFISQTVNESGPIVLNAYQEVLGEAVREA